MQLRSVSILGVGLLGGSIALAIRRRINDCKIVGYGHRTETIEKAIQLGLIDHGYTQPADAVRGADLVLLCTPVGIFPDLLGSIAPVVGEALVSDVGSTKRSVVDLAEKILPKPGHFVGGHPMAGSEKRGLEFARADLCDGGLCILTPTANTNPQTLDVLRGFWELLGMRTTCLSPEAHDRAVAQISHLPHALAALLLAGTDAEAMPLAGKGFSDVTRIGAGDAGLWRDIFLDNRDNMKACISRVKRDLEQFESLLDPDRAEQLKSFLDAAARRRGNVSP